MLLNAALQLIEEGLERFLDGMEDVEEKRMVNGCVIVPSRLLHAGL